MKYGIERVSTTGQERNGNSLEDQREKLLAAGVPEENIVRETYTGTTMERPKLQELLNRLEPGDELVVCKLDRLARTSAEGSILIRDLVNRGITVNVLNMGKADNTPMGKLMITMLLAFAEYERDMIVERTQSGKAVAREREGYKEGRPRIEKPDDLGEIQRLVDAGEITVKAACERLGISQSTWRRWRKEIV